MTVMMRIIKHFLIAFLLMYMIAANAQQQDFQTRLGVELSGDLSKKLDWSVAVQQRWRSNSSMNDRSFLQGSVGYSPLSFLTLGLGYRGSFVQYAGDFAYKQRMHTDVGLDYRFDRVKLLYRARMQYGFGDFDIFSSLKGETMTWRHRLGAKYSPFGWPLHPNASVEFFQKLNAPDEANLKGLRYTLGFEYYLNHDLSLEVDYLLNKELNVSRPLTEHIWSAGLAYKF